MCLCQLCCPENFLTGGARDETGTTNMHYYRANDLPKLPLKADLNYITAKDANPD